VLVGEDQYLGAGPEAMVEAGVSADGNVLGSVMTMAVLSDGELTPVRRSKRNADVADVHSLEKAEKRVAIKNLEDPQGNAKAVINSVVSFSSDRIEQNLGGVGISLGGRENLIAGSIALIKDVEQERLKPSYVGNSIDKECESEEDEVDPDTSTIDRLYGDLTEEVMDDSNVGVDGVFVDIPIKVAKNKKFKKLLNRKASAKKKIVQMKGIFWNCRGLHDLAKHTFLHDVAKDKRLDFIALSETNRNNFSTQCLENFCAGTDFVWHWRCPRGMSGGC